MTTPKRSSQRPLNAPSLERTRLRERPIVLVGLGQAMESYDFLLIGLLSPFLGAHFFSAAGQSPIVATLNALAVYGVGFMFRPLGAAIFGTLADRIGRKPIMLLSVGSMAASSLIIGLLPSVATIGVTALIVLVAVRIVQGLAFGVELPLNATYNVELGKRDKLGRYAGIIAAFIQAGLLTASVCAFLVSLALSKEAMQDWGWRVPFLLGAVFGVVVMVLRRKLPETLHDAKAEETEEIGNSAQYVATDAARSDSASIWRQAWKHRLALLTTVFVVGGVQILNYSLNVALPSIAQAQYGVPPTTAFAATIAFGLVILLLGPLVGLLSDRWKVSQVYVAGRWVLLPAPFLLLAYSGGSTAVFIVIMVVGALLLTPSLALFNVIGASLVPAEGRTAGAGLAYSIGVALFGGTASYLFIWAQIHGFTLLFCIYGSVICLLSIVLYKLTLRRTGLYAGH
jgi:MHS family alpha-ketoglutarate permease-like MFS transporter